MPTNKTTAQNDPDKVQPVNTNPPDPQNRPGAILPELQGDSLVKLQWESVDFDIRAIDKDAFIVECSPMSHQHDPGRIGPVMNGTLSTKDSELIPVLFRVTGFRDNLVRCSYYDLDTATQGKIDSLVDRLDSPKRSTWKSKVPRPGAVSTERRPTSKKLKYALLACAGIMCTGFFMGKPEKTVAVTDSYFGERSVVVQTPEPGRLVELLVDVGDQVNEGDVMAKLVKGDAQVKIENIDAKLETTEKELQVFETQKMAANQTVMRTKQVVAKKLAMAEEMKSRMATKVNVAKETIQRLQPLIQSENIGTLEVAELQAAVKTAQADLDAQEQTVSELKVAMKAAGRGAVSTGDGTVTSTKELANKIKMIEAKKQELQRTRGAIQQVIETVDIVAPKSGVVHAVLLSKDKELDAADKAIELKLADGVLLTGFVAPERASSIKPGQPVEVSVPKRNLTLNGQVTLVGQVARLNLQTKERRLPTDVAVQVHLDSSGVKIDPSEKLEVSVLTEPSSRSAVSSWLLSMFSGDGSDSQ